MTHEQLKLSILQSAFQGKLTGECLPNETADDLYQQIQSEKQRLISEKKIKKELDDLSMEKVGKMAKKKAKEIEKSMNDLVDYVKEKGTPVLEDAVESLRLKAIEVTNSVINKLEKKED